jgi:hypothetical protein
MLVLIAVNSFIGRALAKSRHAELVSASMEQRRVRT